MWVRDALEIHVRLMLGLLREEMERLEVRGEVDNRGIFDLWIGEQRRHGLKQ